MKLELVPRELDASLTGVEPKGNTLQMVGNLGKGKSYSNQNRYDTGDLTDLFFTSYLVKKYGILILELLSVVKNYACVNFTV